MNYFDPNEYEFNTTSNDGVYIIHGFTNTTYETRDLAEYLADKGFYTNAINLPGHGTTPEDCNRYSYMDWIQYTEQGIAEMSSKCDNTYVIGVSMGSDLALHLCATFPLTAAVFASTVLEFKDYLGPRILAPIFHKLIPFRKKEMIYENLYEEHSYCLSIHHKKNQIYFFVFPYYSIQIDIKTKHSNMFHRFELTSVFLSKMNQN